MQKQEVAESAPRYKQLILKCWGLLNLLAEIDLVMVAFPMGFNGEKSTRKPKLNTIKEPAIQTW